MKRFTPLPFFALNKLTSLTKHAGFLMLFLLTTLWGKAQVNITSTGGTPAASYGTLKLAFDSINSGAHTGNIIIAITGNTTESASAVLNASGSGAASYTGISISPSGGASRTISGSLAAALIDLNGADNVIIDGLNSGGNALIIENTNTGAAGVSTIRFINDACSNQLKNTTVRGASTAVTVGTILFSTGTTTGNDNNLIMGCTLEGAGATFPANAIASIGTATAGIENSGNFITQNNISNFFSATLITNGVLAGAGNTDWAISRNRFYQTATRTYTTANTHQIISITSGNGHRVDSNTIGYNSAAGTGTYTMTSTVATRLIAIELSVGTAVATSVQFNTITAISLATSSGASTGNGILCGISVKAGNANIGTIYGNTIGATTGTGAITATPTSTQGAIVGINSATTGTIQIHNNYVGALTSSGSTAAVAGGIFGVTVSAVAASISIQYNTFGNATADNMRAGTSGLTTGSSLCAGISAASSSTIAVYSHNTIRNLTSIGSGTTCYVRGIATSISAGSTLIKIDTNNIYNLTTNTGLTAETSGQLGAVGILFGSGQGGQAVGNIIHDIAITNASTAATDAAGIVIVANGNPRVHGNQIYKIRNASTSTSATTPGTASGIFIRSGVASSPINIYNNMISLGAGETGNIAFIGIWAQHGATPDPIDSIYHNTVTIEGIVTSGAQPSFALARTDFGTSATTVPMIVLNNIFTNNRSGGTGKHFAINNNYGATTPSATGWGLNASDYNTLNAITASTVGSWGSVEKTFADWKTISNCDVHSFTAVPVHYVDSSMNLHLNIGTTPNSMESNALILANVMYDFDGDIRPGPVGSVNGGGSIPDMGADEFDGVGLDFTAPSISYTNLSKTCSTSDRMLTATINDQTGVYLAGALVPRIYYRKSSVGIWVSQPGTLISGTTTNGTWNFPVLSSDMGGISTGDSIFYYVIAQDSGAVNVNIRSLPAGVVASDVNSVTTPPAANAYEIGVELNGSSYTLNSTTANSPTNFQTLASLQTTLNTGCLTGPVTIEITTGTGPYTGALVIPEILGLSSINTFTFNGNNQTIQHTPTAANRHILKLDGADYVTIKNLNIVGLALDFDWGIHLTNGADYDSILNCTVDLSLNTATAADNAACIAASASTTDINLGGNNTNYLTVKNCELIGGFQTVIINGNVSNYSMHNTISNNIIRDFYSIGVELTYNDSTTVENNNIHRANRTTVTTFEGIELGAGNKQSRINANRIHNTHDAASVITGSAYGIFSSANDAPVGFENRITNNIIYNFNSGSGTIYALYNSGSDGAYYYHNTISLDYAAATAGITRGFFQTTAATNIDFRNNIISITRGGTGVKYCLYFATITSAIISNKNDLYMNAPAGTNGIGYFNSGQTTLADWKLVNSSAYDQQSLTKNPNFTDPLINNYTPKAFSLNDYGDSVGVFTDFSGIVRPNNTPDLGAIEYTPPPIDGELLWIAPQQPVAAGNQTITVNIKNNSSSIVITDLEIEYTDGVTPVSEVFSGLSIATLSSQQLSFTAQYNLSGPVNLRAYIKSVNGIADGTQENDTASQSLCAALAAGSYTIDASLPTGSSNFNSFTSAVNALSCGILGPVVFDVVPGNGPYVEQLVIPQVAGSSLINTITFNGHGDTLQFTPNTSARHIIKLDGADYIILRNIYIRGLAADFDWGINLTNEADYDSIVDCVIDLSASTTTTVDNGACIVASASSTDVNLAGNNASNLTVTGCTLIGGYYGAVINGNGLNTQNNNIINSTIRDFYSIGIEYTNMDSCLIERNDITRATRVAVTTFEGIELGTLNKRINVSKNKIHDTHNSATTQSGTAYGIYSSANDAPVGFENIVSNNLIYNFNSLTGTIYGIYSSGSDGVHYYYNTIDLSYPDATAGTTYGIYQLTEASNVIIKNNIVSITRGGSGTKNCLRFGTASSSITSNNNLLYMNASGTVGVGYYNTNAITLADWKLANGGAFDQQSVGTNPLFNSSSLLIPLPTSPAEGAGTPISGITNDIIDTLRDATNPTIGAYEKVVDMVNPTVSFTPLLNTVSTTSPTLIGFASITDVSGIDTSAHKPRLYYKKTTDDNAYVGNTSGDNGWKWVEASNTTSPFNFTIDYNLLLGGAVSGGDSIQYFIVAQDFSENTNVGASSGISFANTPDSVDLLAGAFPISGTIQLYRILPIIAGGTITVGASGNYQKITDALAYLKQNHFTSDVTVELLADYDGTTGESFPLSFDNISRSDSSIKVIIRPEGNVSSMLTTAGIPNADMPLIDLNATHHIYFDGRPGGSGDMTNIKWTIRNKRADGTFTPTIRFINEAQHNILEYLNIQSANAVATSGTILFSTTTGTLGNDSNIIRYNIIRDRSDSIGMPANAIFSNGTDEATNHGIDILDNQIFNWSASGVHVTATGNGNGWNINNNQFYMTAAAATAQTAIRLLSAGNTNQIIGNAIGGTAANAGGSAWTNSGGIAWRGIVCAVGTQDSTFIKNNTIQNIALTGTATGTYAGIEVTGGRVSINGNTIGHLTTSNSITSALLGTHLSITITSTPIATIYNNTIANITSTGTTNAVGHRGISHTGSNTTDAIVIRNNTIHKLSVATVTVSSNTSAVQGIYTSSANTNQQIVDNTISNLSSDGGPSGVSPTRCNGINVGSTTGSGIIARNKVYDFLNTSSNTDALVIGINLFAGANWTIANNMVSLGTLISSNARVVGIMDSTSGTVNVLHNSVSIEGNYAGASPDVKSYGFRKLRTSVTTVKNNIFNNIRTGSVENYAIGSTGGSWQANYNDLYSTNASTVGEWNGTARDFAAWKTASLQDLSSINSSVAFVSSTDLHLTSPTIGNNSFAGRYIGSIPTDIDGEARASVYPYMGADEDINNPLTPTLAPLGGNFTIGATGTYTSLTVVANLLNNSELVSDVLFELQSDYDGTVGEVFPIYFNQIMTNGTPWKVTIRPAASVTARVTAGDAGSAGALIAFDGVDNLMFDGRPDGGTTSEWTIRNTRTTATTGPAISFTNDARYNTLRNLTIESANTVSTSGTILIGSTTKALGNDSNTIISNKIRDLSTAAGIPANAIYSSGNAAASNHYNKIDSNEIFNFTTSAINISATGNGGNWYIGNNNIYYNSATIPTTAQTAILFAAASNYNTITHNTIGGTTINAGGTPWVHNGTTAFIGISASFDSLSVSTVSRNIVRNFTKTNTGGGAVTGIVVTRGNALVNYNLIGDSVNANSITNAGTAAIVGISNTNALVNTLVTIEHNRVANMTNSNIATGAVIRGISFSSGSPYPSCHILHNRISNLSSNSTAAAYTGGSIVAQGIYCFPAGGYGPTSEVGYNTIYEITGTNTTAATNVSGVTASNFPGSIHHNIIYNIKNHSLASGNTIRGTANGLYMRFLDSATAIHNNMISLTNNPSDSVQLNGVMVTGANGNVHFYFYNSIHIGNTSGQPVSSFAFHRGENSLITQSYQPIVMQNNLFINTVSSPGLHYAIGNEGTRPDSSWISSINDYNNFYSVNPANLTLWGTTTGDLASWKTLSLGDANSISKNVNFSNTAAADLHLSGASIGDFDLGGTPVLNYTTDFDGEARNSVRPYMGADENLASPVPVTLTKFIAQRSSKNVIVYWSTASEINAHKFIIQASADGKSFKQIGTVKAKGNSATLTEYQLTHLDAQLDMNNASTIYYRMISVDIDGSSATSQVVKVDFNKALSTKLEQVVVYPNPFNDNIHLIIPSDVTEMATITLIDMQGKVILSHQYSISEGLNNITLDMLENLKKGLFFVKVILNNETRVVKILKD